MRVRRSLRQFGIGRHAGERGKSLCVKRQAHLKGDDLAGIGGIGEDFLVAGHARIEHDFTHTLALGPEPPALEHRAVVGEDVDCAEVGEVTGGEAIIASTRGTVVRSSSSLGRYG